MSDALIEWIYFTPWDPISLVWGIVLEIFLSPDEGRWLPLQGTKDVQHTYTMSYENQLNWFSGN